MLGEEKFNKLCDDVWVMMTKTFSKEQLYMAIYHENVHRALCRNYSDEEVAQVANMMIMWPDEALLSICEYEYTNDTKMQESKI